MQLFALCCLSAVGLGIFAAYVRQTPGQGLLADLVGSVALGLVAGSNREDVTTRDICLLAGAAVFVLIGTTTARTPAISSGLFFVPGFVLASLVGLLTAAVAPKIVEVFASVYRHGPTAIDRINRIIRSFTLTLAAVSALWVAIKKFIF